MSTGEVIDTFDARRSQLNERDEEDKKFIEVLSANMADGEFIQAISAYTEEFEQAGADKAERRYRKTRMHNALNTAIDAFLIGMFTPGSAEDWVSELRKEEESILNDIKRVRLKSQQSGEKETKTTNRQTEAPEDQGAFLGRMQQRQAEEHRRVRKERDQLAAAQGLPEYFESEDEPEHTTVKNVVMGDYAALYLEDEKRSLVTDSLASCTGVTLYDPQSRVGALIHVYDLKDYPKISGGMIAAMQKEALAHQLQLGGVADFHAALMPGNRPGVNDAHRVSIHEQLQGLGITKVRDFFEEGLQSDRMRLMFGGRVAIV